ncbi:hypothetical protein VFDL14_05030 [Vibrio fortis]|uniref:Uncharacterized protein n=1 Tax=Vibrio fortis TaxID=212667 RepID=A0A066V0R5_9VIBR|nr:LPO_1073/Vpar_1526 family protein [Vibrio fortis]KDN30099.1 hypothetical protein VFDL14_05030 [Vibrio fortis]
MMDKQNQKGGDGSTNIQADKIILQTGIDEKRAREVFQEMNLQLRKDYTREALEIAESRVAEFENSLMPKMESVEGALQAFSDPSFQILLVEAQKTAASTERPADYELLSELLVHRFKKGENRITRAGVSVAVDIIDKISDEALLGLTVTHAVNNFSPTSGELYGGLDTLNALFGKIFYGPLPTGYEWLDHLEILNTVRLSSFATMKKTNDYYPNLLAGYVDVGIEKDSEVHATAIKELESCNLPAALLSEHSLNNKYVRIPVVNKGSISRLTLQRTIPLNDSSITIPVMLTDEQKAVLESIYDMYSNDQAIRQNNINLFMDEWNKRDNLRVLREWWDAIPTSLTITSAGRVLAHSNAQRCDNKLPQLD